MANVRGGRGDPCLDGCCEEVDESGPNKLGEEWRCCVCRGILDVAGGGVIGDRCGRTDTLFGRINMCLGEGGPDRRDDMNGAGDFEDCLVVEPEVGFVSSY